MPINNYLNNVIREMDELACCHPASVNVSVGNTYYALTKMLRPLKIVEIGCFIGFSTHHFAQALRELGFGTILSIDAFDWEIDAGHGLQNRQIIAEHYKQKANIGDIVSFVKGYSDRIYPEIENQIKNQIDLLYIDGDHSVDGVFKDFNRYYDDVRKGGYIILHDIYPKMCGVDGPRVLIDTLKNLNLSPTVIEIIELQTEDGYGIALLRKLSSAHLNLSPNLQQIDQSLLLAPNIYHNNDNYAVVFEITDAQSKTPIAGAKFICPQRTHEERTTLADGLISMPHYQANRYLINFYAEGYIPIENRLVDISFDKEQFFFKIEMQKIT